MQVFATTPLALFLLIYIFVRGPVKGLWCLFLVLPMGAAAAMNVSGLGSIYMTDFVIIAMWASLLFFRTGFSEVFATLRPGRPGFLLLLLLVVSLLSAYFMPRFFRAETEVFMLVKVPDWGMAFRLRPLEPTTQNISQAIRLVISTSAFVVLATLFRAYGNAQQVHKCMILATWLNVLLAFLDVTSHAVGFNDLLDIIRTSNMAMLDDQRIMGFKRIAGGFAEASAFGFYTMGLFAYWFRYWFSDQTSWKSGLIVALLLALIIRSTSSSTYVALGAFLGLYFVWHFRTMFKARRAFLIYTATMVAVPAMLIVLVLTFALSPVLQGMLDELLLSKMSSDSGVERMMWNTQAFTAMLDTYGLGAGIGSVRASSFLYACLGNIGIVGTVLYLVFIYQVLMARPPLRSRESYTSTVAAALQASCVGILLQAMMSTPYPNLDVVFFAHAGLAMGLLRHQELVGRRRVRRRAYRPMPISSARAMI